MAKDLYDEFDTDITDDIDGEPIERVIAMVTIKDNPWDYFTNFREWYMWDRDHGYDTCGYLARIVDYLGGTDNCVTEVEEMQLIERAVDEIIEFNPLPIYKKITRTYLV